MASETSAASTPASTPAATPDSQRRTSMEEDYFYREVMTVPKKPTEPPPAYGSTLRKILSGRRRASLPAPDGAGAGDVLPAYSCEIHLEGAFLRKMEIEHVTKKAVSRRWGEVYAVLHGTSLALYHCKKARSHRSADGGPAVAPDNPPWLARGALEKSYSLAYADVGIAADYRKRRYVIRVRAETDQFLLSCIELATFVRWLDALFAAIDVAAPIDDREFPRDQSIPRIQRLRWLRGQDPHPPGGEGEPPSPGQQPATEQQPRPPEPSAREQRARARAAAEATTRLATTPYAFARADAGPGKWAPLHTWTGAHDMVYARLCYAVLNFGSPRRSKYIIVGGRQWAVDWTTGAMARVSPPRYGETEPLTGPFQVLRTENMRL